MSTVFSILVAIGAVAAFVWLLRGSASTGTRQGTSDPDETRLIGLLIGLSGGSITDAAVARYALQRFEEVHGRKATDNDLATVVGLMQGL